jgi:hypothetical protein
MFPAGATFFASPLAVAEQRRKTRIFLLQFAGTRQEAFGHSLQFARVNSVKKDHLNKF